MKKMDLGKKAGIGFMLMYIFQWVLWFGVWIIFDMAHFQMDTVFDSVIDNFNQSSNANMQEWLSDYGTTDWAMTNAKRIVFFAHTIGLVAGGVAMAYRERGQSQGVVFR